MEKEDRSDDKVLVNVQTLLPTMQCLLNTSWLHSCFPSDYLHPKLCPRLAWHHHSPDKCLLSTTTTSGTILLGLSYQVTLGILQEPQTQPPVQGFPLPSTAPPSMYPSSAVMAAISRPEAPARHLGRVFTSRLSLHPTSNQL